MADFIESARAILSQSERRMEATANNVANITTPGFKNERLYSEMSAGTDALAPETLLKQTVDFTQGQLSKTSNPLDLAIAGPGMFRLAGADGSTVYTRSGQFKLVDGGRVVNAQGLALQSADGGDLIVANQNIQILADGTVLDGDRPIAKVGVYQAAAGAQMQPLGGSLFSAAEGAVDEVAQPSVRQGMLEASNVALANEMVNMMDALRQAEGAAKLVQTYDDLMGKAVSTFGQGTR